MIGVLKKARQYALPSGALAHVGALAHAKGQLCLSLTFEFLSKVNGKGEGDDMRLRRRSSLVYKRWIQATLVGRRDGSTEAQELARSCSWVGILST